MPDLSTESVLNAVRTLRSCDTPTPAFDTVWRWWIGRDDLGDYGTYPALSISQVIADAGLTGDASARAHQIADAMIHLSSVDIDPEHVLQFTFSPLPDGSVLAVCATEYSGRPGNPDFFSSFYRIADLARPDAEVDVPGLALLAGLSGYLLPDVSGQSGILAQ